MNAQQMWNAYSKQESITADYEAWSYGDAPDQLAQLTLNGIKTGTSSLYLWYGLENEELPKAGQYSVILDSCENAVCIIQTTNVHIVPFDEVPESHAFREGEGDRTLSYWRNVHENFFTKELQQEGLAFDSKIKVVCEEFIKVYP